MAQNRPSHPQSISVLRRRFTLVELLVVITILAILTALLLPTLQNSLHVAKDVSCLNQQRQIAAAVVTYAGDHSGFLPYNDVTGTHLYFPDDNYNLSGRIINAHYSGLGLLYSGNYISVARMLWCANEDAPKKQNASENTEGYKRLAAATPPTSPSGSVGTDYAYRCGWWNKEKNMLERISTIRSPDDGLIMCASTNSVNRISWQELHQARGFNLSLADGSGRFFSFSAHLTPDLWGGNNYRIADYPKQTLIYASRALHAH